MYENRLNVEVHIYIYSAYIIISIYDSIVVIVDVMPLQPRLSGKTGSTESLN